MKILWERDWNIRGWWWGRGRRWWWWWWWWWQRREREERRRREEVRRWWVKRIERENWNSIGCIMRWRWRWWRWKWREIWNEMIRKERSREGIDRGRESDRREGRGRRRRRWWWWWWWWEWVRRRRRSRRRERGWRWINYGCVCECRTVDLIQWRWCVCFGCYWMRGCWWWWIQVFFLHFDFFVLGVFWVQFVHPLPFFFHSSINRFNLFFCIRCR